uniref:HDC02249 n=1 Tax=Drosophila melanogaster TaxID=7227 RepID=Q6IHL7_DROME|nr:TPA_inf: HDC02249 [Drosophila melanogaster]
MSLMLLLLLLLLLVLLLLQGLLQGSRVQRCGGHAHMCAQPDEDEVIAQGYEDTQLRNGVELG